MTITLIPFQHLEIRNTFIIDFLSSIENEFIIEKCEDILESFCRSMKDCLSKKESKDTKDIIAMYLEKYEERQITRHSELEKKLIDSQQVQLTKSLYTFTENINASLSRYNVDTFQSTIQNSVQNCIQIYLETYMKNEQSSTILFQNQLRSDIQNSFKPIIDANTDIMKHITHEIETKIQTMSIPELHKVRESIECIIGNVYTKQELLKDSITRIDQYVVETLQKCAHQQETLSHIPSLTKNIMNDMFTNIEKDSNITTSQLKDTLTHIQLLLLQTNTIVNQNESIQSRLDTIDKDMYARVQKQEASLKVKGSSGETKIFDLLSEKLLMRDGYILEAVHGMARNCDIIIKRESYPTIRIECKAHGHGTGEKVRYKEVEKFQRDLLDMNDHGIFVSFYSDIVGVSNYDIQQLANGKFAVYLCNNNYDVDMIISMIHIIYRLDALCTQETHEHSLILTKDSLLKIHEVIKGFTSKIQCIRAHMKDSLQILNDIQLDTLEKMLTCNNEYHHTTNEEFVCKSCNKTFKSSTGLKRHICKQKNF